MPLSPERRAEIEERRAEIEERCVKIAGLWRAGLTAAEIAARLNTTEIAVQGLVVRLQRSGIIERRMKPRQQAHRVQKTVGRPSMGASTPIDRARSHANYEREKDAWAKAKRVVTIAQARGELRVIKFFGDCAEAAAAPRVSITGVCAGAVTNDAVFMASGGGKSNVWALWQVLEGVAA